MKNEHILPNTLVPEDIRLEVYKEALDIIKRGEHRYCINGFFLCFLLPCVLWDLGDYLDDSPSDNTWSFKDTTTLFPEISHWIFDITNSSTTQVAHQRRILCLEEAIQKLTNQHGKTTEKDRSN